MLGDYYLALFLEIGNSDNKQVCNVGPYLIAFVKFLKLPARRTVGSRLCLIMASIKTLVVILATGTEFAFQCSIVVAANDKKAGYLLLYMQNLKYYQNVASSTSAELLVGDICQLALR